MKEVSSRLERMSLTRYLWDTYNSIPVVTRFCSTCNILLALAVNLDIISKYDVYFNPWLTFGQLQFWRLVTCFFFVGKIDMFFILHVQFAYRYCYMLETGEFANKTHDFIWMFLLGMGSLLGIGYQTNAIFLDHPLGMMLVYIWARRNPELHIEVFGLVVLKAVYLPFVILALSIIFDDPIPDLIGLAVGHTYYHAHFVFPSLPNGFPIVVAPSFLKRLCSPTSLWSETALTRNIVDESIEMPNEIDPRSEEMMSNPTIDPLTSYDGDMTVDEEYMSTLNDHEEEDV